MRRLLVLFLALAVLSCTLLAQPLSAEVYGARVAASLDQAKVLEHARALSALGSRVVGYPGYYRAVDYITRKLGELGYSVEVQEFRVLAPIETEAYVEVGGERLKVHAVWPNAMFVPPSTPLEGVSGKLVYVGGGEARDFDGKEIEGSIVLMDFNSGDNWLRAADLGAKAVVFIEPDDTNSNQALAKFTMAPIHFVRVYATKDTAARLLELQDRVARLVVRVEVKEVKAYNILVRVNGTSYPNEAIVVAAYFDSWSVVPAVSRGFIEALSPSLLLELARVLKEEPPARSVWLAFLSGFHEGLAGPREFVERYFYSPEVAKGELKLWMLLGIQLTDESPRVLSTFVGFGLRYGAGSSVIAGKYTWVKGRLYAYSQSQQLLSLVSKALGYTPKPEDVYEDYLEASGWWGTQQAPYMLVSEPATMAGTVSFTLKTAYYRGYRWGIPLDDSKYARFENFWAQALTSSFMVASLAAEGTWGLSWEAHSPVRFTVRVGAIEGFVEFRGEVCELDVSTGWYKPVPGAIVRVYPEGPTSVFAWPFSAYLTLTSGNGTFRAIVGPRGSTPTWLFDAWVLNSSTGKVVYATDRGPLYGLAVLKSSLMPLSPVEGAIIPVFKAHSLTLYRVFSPSTLRRPVILDPRMPIQPLLASTIRLDVYDFDTKGYPYFFGFWYNPWEYPMVVFGQPGSRLTVNIRVGYGWPELALVNASDGLSEGSGFLMSSDATITRSYLKTASDMLLLAEGRYVKLKEKGVRSLSAEELLSNARRYLKLATAALENRNYSAYEAFSVAALTYASKAYKDEVMPLYDDAGKSGLALFALLVPSAFLLERLLVHTVGGGRRVASLLAVGASLLGVFYAIHPALSVLASSAMSVMGVLLVLLFAVTVAVLGSEAGRVMEEEAERAMGAHKVDRSPFTNVALALPLALENMRKRPLRTSLTLAALVAVAIAVTSLTSVSYYTDVKFSSVAPPPEASALLVKRGYAVPLYDVLDIPLLSYLEATAAGFEARPRAWLYPAMGAKQGYSAPLYKVGSFNTSYNIAAVLGLGGREAAERVAGALVEGLPPEMIRKLFDEGREVCLLPKSATKTLGVEVGDSVNYAGLELTVVGVYEEAALEAWRDLDGTPPAPIKPEHNSVLAMQPPGPPPSVPSSVSWREVVIVPYRLAITAGGYLASVALEPLTGTEGRLLLNVSRSITLATDLKVYAGIEGIGVLSGARVASYMFLGWEVIPVVLAIGALNVAMTLLGNLKERTREIYVFTAVGLSPLGAALMYVTETLTYAVVSVVAGYVLGFAANRALAAAGLLPSAYALNYASTFIVLAFAVLIASALAASLYPSIVAATMITPSLERKWKPPTKPRGDTWEIPIPVRFPSREEALGSLFYIYEYFAGMGKERPYFIVREASPPSRENPAVRIVVALAPYELGVTQEAVLQLLADDVRRVYTFSLKLTRLTGSRSVWEANNYYFIDDARKQALMWRTLPPDKRSEYVKRVYRV